MAGTVFLEGEKINLRTIEEEDIEFLRDGVNHPEVRVYMGNRRPQNLENEEEFFEEQVCGEDTVHLMISRKYEKYVSILDLFVKDGYRSQGYGTEMMKKAEEYAEKQGCDHLKVSAEVENTEARSFYEKNGYKEKQIKYVKEV